MACSIQDSTVAHLPVLTDHNAVAPVTDCWFLSWGNDSSTTNCQVWTPLLPTLQVQDLVVWEALWLWPLLLDSAAMLWPWCLT